MSKISNTRSHPRPRNGDKCLWLCSRDQEWYEGTLYINGRNIDIGFNIPKLGTATELPYVKEKRTIRVGEQGGFDKLDTAWDIEDIRIVERDGAPVYYVEDEFYSEDLKRVFRVIETLGDSLFISSRGTSFWVLQPSCED